VLANQEVEIQNIVADHLLVERCYVQPPVLKKIEEDMSFVGKWMEQI
jgi:hypothetical protein